MSRGRVSRRGTVCGPDQGGTAHRSGSPALSRSVTKSVCSAVAQPREAAERRTLVRAGAQLHDVSVSRRTTRSSRGSIASSPGRCPHEATFQTPTSIRELEGTRSADASRGRGQALLRQHDRRLPHASASEVGRDSPLEPDNIYGPEASRRARRRRVTDPALPQGSPVSDTSKRRPPSDKLSRRGKGLLVRGKRRQSTQPIYIEDLRRAALRRAPGSAEGTTLYWRTGARTTRDVARVASPRGARPHRPIPLSPLVWTAWALEKLLRTLGSPPLHRRRMDFFRKSFRFQGAGAHKTLGFEPRVDLETGMAATARWYQAQGLLPGAAAHGARA